MQVLHVLTIHETMKLVPQPNFLQLLSQKELFLLKAKKIEWGTSGNNVNFLERHLDKPTSAKQDLSIFPKFSVLTGILEPGPELK